MVSVAAAGAKVPTVYWNPGAGATIFVQRGPGAGSAGARGRVVHLVQRGQ